MGLRILQRLYPDVDDSGGHPDGAGGGTPIDDAAAQGSRDQAGRQLGDGDAVARRRLRGLRCRQRFRLAQLAAVCRCRGGHRSTCPGPDRTRARDDGGGGVSRRHPVARRAIAWLKRTRRATVRMVGTLGRQLYLRNLFGAGRACARSASIERDFYSSAPRDGLSRYRRPTVDWGESCLADQDSALAQAGNQHPSQTAWALIGLLAADENSATTRCAASPGCGTSERRRARGTRRNLLARDSPNHFYLRYHLYAHYFPLMALGAFGARLVDRAAAKRGDNAMKTLAILGSTGSVGVTTLDVVGRFPRSLSRRRDGGGQQPRCFAQQVRRFRPELVSVATANWRAI